MEKGIEEEEDNLYKATDSVTDAVTDKLSNISSKLNLDENQIPAQNNSQNQRLIIDYSKMADAFLLALNSSETITEIKNTLKQILASNQKPIVLSTGELVSATAEAYDIALANNQTRRERGN